MEFNENWTKEDNDKLRQFNKEKKSTDEIINYFGKDKLKYHPTGKYCGQLDPFIFEAIQFGKKQDRYSVKHIPLTQYNMLDFISNYESDFKTKNNKQYIFNYEYLPEYSHKIYRFYKTTFNITELPDNKKDYVDLFRKCCVMFKRMINSYKIVFIIEEIKDERINTFCKNFIRMSLEKLNYNYLECCCDFNSFQSEENVRIIFK